jgi:hypothetical protein
MEFEAFGVSRDVQGRPVSVTRYSYGNPDSRHDWATMKIEYRPTDSLGSLFVRRTFFAPNGMPVDLGPVHAEEVLYKRGVLAMRRLVDTAGRLTGDTTGLSQSYFRPAAGGLTLQEFFFGAGKQLWGADLPDRPFAPLPQKAAYFRLFKADTAGRLEREELQSFMKQPIPFPGGEYVRVYTPGACGLPARVDFLDTQGRPMADSSGIAYETFGWDDRGRMIEWRGWDASGNPKGRAGDGAARIERTYRAFDGVLLGEQRFDAAGRLLEAN